MKKLMLVVLMLFVSVTTASAGQIYRTEINGVKFYTNKKINSYNKSWNEIEFNAERHKARLERERKLQEQWDKEDQVRPYRIKRSLSSAKHARLHNSIDRPKFYEHGPNGLEPIYVYPNISTRQAHAKAGHPLYWR